MEQPSTSPLNNKKDGGTNLLANFGTKVNRKLESLSLKERVGTGLGLTVGICFLTVGAAVFTK
jgi:hypothetical protein